MLRFQRTIKAAMHCEGIGLHTGKKVRMSLKPAPIDTGIIFKRTDLGGTEIKAVAANTAATSYATTLCENGASVKTVEHLLAAFAGLGIDNVSVEIDAEEVPVMDGSAAPFVKLIADAGVLAQERPRPVLKVTNPVFVREGNKQIAIWPSDKPSISYFIDFNHPLLKEQSLHFPVSEEGFLREIADARTFGFMSDVQELWANGLAMGGSMDNAVILGEKTVLNKEGLRHKDEFVRHKILDLIGDLSLAGMPILGHIVAHKSGHGLNKLMVSKLLSSPQSWIVLGSEEAAEKPREVLYRQQMAL
ncbi:MAG TPA: UDP-3-O-acyl-N-acetylglucosamine deacetylase [Nitrospirota bacterium]|nr:UDP-3-O-acyl-N-acetylglucosamine deacetylase [Nitrospirota bacterium]